jgi:hypothetical protein
MAAYIHIWRDDAEAASAIYNAAITVNSTNAIHAAQPAHATDDINTIARETTS